jgi:alpha-beta hydrolase superfamily lysophospholipase
MSIENHNSLRSRFFHESEPRRSRRGTPPTIALAQSPLKEQKMSDRKKGKRCGSFLSGMIWLLLLAAVIAGFGFAGILAAAEGIKSGSWDAHESHTRMHFKDNEMEFSLALILGAAMNSGCEIGEAFFTACRITEGDSSSWQKEWTEMANRVEARGDKSSAKGHGVSAREQYMRASYYYRAAMISMLPDSQNFKKTALKSRTLLIKAGKLLDPPLEYFEIPFDGTVLPGYYRKASRDRKKHKTLIMIGGGETFAEDLVFYIARQAHERGYNFLTVDLPGQGLLPLEGKFFRRDVEVPLKAVVDYALTRSAVDPKRLAMFGISGGGGFVPRAAQFDHRIKAIVMNSAVVDAHRLFAAMPVATMTEDIMKQWSSFKANTIRVIAWRWGVAMDNIPGLVKANSGFEFDPAQIVCPALSLVGAGEYADVNVQEQQRMFLNGVPHSKRFLVVTPADEGASNHCLTENRSVMSQEVFDFLDDAFENRL